MQQRIPEKFSTTLIDWNPLMIMGNTVPPRNPDEDEENEENEENEEDEDNEDEDNNADEPPIVREPD